MDTKLLSYKLSQHPPQIISVPALHPPQTAQFQLVAVHACIHQTTSEMSCSHEKHTAEAQHRACFTSSCRREERTSQAPFSPCSLPVLRPQKTSSGCLQQLLRGAAISAITANLQAAVQHPEGVLSAHSSHQLPFVAAHPCRY